jgi:hypothetical protein
MSTNRPRFTFSSLVTWLSLFAFAFLPLLIVIDEAIAAPVPMKAWSKAVIWGLAIVAMFFYARARCSYEKLQYIDALSYVARSLQIWGMGISLLLIFPSICFTLIASVAIAARNDLRGKRNLTPHHFYKLITKIYTHRLHP